MQYQVMRKGHKVGHHRLEYGSVVTAKALGTTDDALRTFVERGVLAQVSSENTEKTGKKTKMVEDA